MNSKISKIMLFVMLSTILFFLVGCSQKITKTLTDSAGNVTDVISTAAVERDRLYMDRGIARDKATQDMYKTQGFTLGWQEVEETVFYPGMEKPVTVKKSMPTVSYKAPHVWNQHIETRPPDHRGWDSLDNLASLGLKGFFGHLLNDYGKESLGAAQTKYYGDYNPQTAEPYVMEPFLVE